MLCPDSAAQGADADCQMMFALQARAGGGNDNQTSSGCEASTRSGATLTLTLTPVMGQLDSTSAGRSSSAGRNSVSRRDRRDRHRLPVCEFVQHDSRQRRIVASGERACQRQGKRFRRGSIEVSAHAAQQESLLTSRVKVWAARWMPSPIVR
jgi:hypothetical protein